MKNKLFLALFLLVGGMLSAQCDVNRCLGENLTLNHNTTATNPQFVWQAPIAFTGQGTGSVTFTNLPLGSHQVILTITDLNTGCINSDTLVVCVTQGVASLTLPEICADAPCIPVSGGSSAGVYSINGVPITQLCPGDAGQLVTFVASGSCPGTATATFNVNPLPIVDIVPQ